MLKRIFDTVFSFVGLVILIPAIILISILIKIKMPGPVFFCQERIGRYGKPFTIYKFRSMIVSHSGNSISVQGEERITPLGAIIRKHKLDELPEIWNILKGDMSFVGPRPDVQEYLSRLEGEEKLILNLRPGLTGPATLKYRHEEEILATVPDPVKYNEEVIWKDKVVLNLEYYHNRSFWGDISIIIMTIFNS